jgi:RNA-directed DNA polymerase
VAQENYDKKTPGIDGVIWTTPDCKHNAAIELRKRSKTKPLKWVSIAKPNGKKHLLAIPCMSDRARQALWNLSLLPCVEAQSYPQSYGFRPYRGFWNANTQTRNILEKPNSPTWVLGVEIKKCFDTINHDWLLANIHMEKKVLKSWLKMGYLESKELFPPEEGTSRAGVISTTLANLSLGGLKNYLKQKFKAERGLSSIGKRGIRIPTCINVVRSANGLIVIGRSETQLERAKQAIKKFLAPRGLQINEEKTSIRSIHKGFNFLGWNFRKYGGGPFLAKISKMSISRHQKEIKYLTKTIHLPEVLIPKLNSKILGWMNYHRCCNGIWKVWGTMNKYLYERLMKWGCKKHSNKTKKWVFENYWRYVAGRWTFSAPNKVTSTLMIGKKNFVAKAPKLWRTNYSSSNISYTLMDYSLKQKRIGTRLRSKLAVFDLHTKAKIRQVQLPKSPTYRT